MVLSEKAWSQTVTDSFLLPSIMWKSCLETAVSKKHPACLRSDVYSHSICLWDDKSLQLNLLTDFFICIPWTRWWETWETNLFWLFWNTSLQNWQCHIDETWQQYFLFIIYYIIYLFIFHDWPFLDFGIIGTCMDFLAEPGDFYPLYCNSPKPLRALSAHEWWHGWHNLLSAHSSHPIEHKKIQAQVYKQESLISILLSARASGWLSWSWPPPGVLSPSLLPW